MIAKLFKLPGWFLSPDDKPTFNTYAAVTNSLTGTTAKTISVPSLDTIVVQSTFTADESQAEKFSMFNAYNYIQYGNNWYQITEVDYVSENNNVIQVTGKLDVYLTWIIPYMEEIPLPVIANIKVYFKQKHLNRYIYNTNYDNGLMVYYQYQFYLLAKHPQLSNASSKVLKNVYTTANYQYQTQTNTTLNAQPNYYGSAITNVNPNLSAYVGILWKLASGNSVQVASNYMVPFGIGGIDGTNQPTWSQLVANTAWEDYWEGIYIFPLPLTQLLSSPPFSTTSTTVQAFTNQSLTSGSYNSSNDYILTLPTNQLYALAIGFSGTIAADNSGTEPAILNWCKCNVRMYGQDNTIDPTSFNYSQPEENTVIWQLYNYLGSFMLTISPPNQMITNIPMSLYSNYYSNQSWVATNFNAWNYNNVNDAIFSIMLKNELPSVTTAWGNYIANNKNSYGMALNITGLECQNAQARIKEAKATYGGSIASFDNVGADLLSIISGSFGNKVASTYNAGIEANTIAPNDADMQQDRLNYLKTGMKQDYSRVSNMRVSAQDCANTLFDSTYTWIYEYPAPFEQLAIINYYALYGYILERWDYWASWNNRKYCNYVKCANWCNAMGTTIPIQYRNTVDSIFNQGFRVWNVAAFNNDYGAIPYNQVIMNTQSTTTPVQYNNVELNENNQEVCYINGITEEQLLQGAPTD